ncbi:hypothetical protein ACFZBU_38790 [Embleya sp. NPDC008237]|uniref:hypothetical protein n=1 Tax=Embleya sp. NPDC008237 TaxID=3363978 RepID=UPI0036EB2FCB
MRVHVAEIGRSRFDDAPQRDEIRASIHHPSSLTATNDIRTDVAEGRNVQPGTAGTYPERATPRGVW